MIPKIIHLCWLSGEEYPNDIKQCIDTWKIHLSDYEIWLWDTKRFDINSTIWTKQAFDCKKYAFAADYIRLYALYNYGGIYLDSDVIVYKSFNDLLELPYFIGQDYTGAFETAIIGTEKQMPWIKDILDYYQNKTFIKEDKNINNTPLPIIFYNCLHQKYLFKKADYNNKYKNERYLIYIFNKDFFNSRNSIGIKKTKKSYCAHNYAGSWINNKNDLKSKIQKLIPKKLLSIYFYITHHTINKKAIRKHKLLFIE